MKKWTSPTGLLEFLVLFFADYRSGKEQGQGGKGRERSRTTYVTPVTFITPVTFVTPEYWFVATSHQILSNLNLRLNSYHHGLLVKANVELFCSAV
eukprot:scaffold61175_cov38-Cyclotella_meneghiniana.AAC.1